VENKRASIRTKRYYPEVGMAFCETLTYYQQSKMKWFDAIGFSIFAILFGLVAIAVWFAL
jgi:hypothetical protein